MAHYDDVLSELREKGTILANQYIVELYNILRDEEKLPPEDCRAKIEHDCSDLWSKATILKFMPSEAKDDKKQKAGKIGAESKTKKRKPILLASGAIDNGARTNLAENDPIFQNEADSNRFLCEDDHRSIADGEPSGSTDTAKPMPYEDLDIEYSKSLNHEMPEQKPSYTGPSYGILILPSKFAEEIHDKIEDVVQGNGLRKVPEFTFKHDGQRVIEIKMAL